MRKYLFVTLLILALTPCKVVSKELIDSPADLEKTFNETFYEAPFAPLPEVEVVEGNQTKPVRGTPVFKKVRIKITNYLRKKDYQKTQELIQKEKQRQAELEAEDESVLDKDLNINFKQTKKEKKLDDKKQKAEKVKEQPKSDEKTLELEGGVKEQVTTNNIVLKSGLFHITRRNKSRLWLKSSFQITITFSPKRTQYHSSYSSNTSTISFTSQLSPSSTVEPSKEKSSYY